MKKIVFLSVFYLVLTSCSTDEKLSEEEKETVIAALNEIKILDQEFAGIPPAAMFEQHGQEKAWEIFEGKRDSVGAINQKKIKNLYKQYGYLGERKIGKNAATDFWVTIQHADNDVRFQQQMLAALAKEIEKGSEDKLHYAMLEDRINSNLGKPQRFGSQVVYNDVAQAIPKNGFADAAVVDSLRAEYGLEPFHEYANQMTTRHFEMNKAYLAEQGITEPQLYE